MQWKLIKLRKEKNLTQKKLSIILGIALQTYRSKESGKSNFSQDEMFILANYFKMSMDQIFLPRKHQNGAFEREVS